MMVAAATQRVFGGVLTILTVISLSSGDSVRRGSDITDCSMKCPHKDGVLLLYRVCGGLKTHLLELWCDTMKPSNPSDPRLHLHTSSGCWTLTDAGKNDSSVYRVVYYGNGTVVLRTLHITVLDPVLISNITSNSSRLGQETAVSSSGITGPRCRLSSSAVLAAVAGILLLLGISSCFLLVKIVLETEEKNLPFIISRIQIMNKLYGEEEQRNRTSSL